MALVLQFCMGGRWASWHPGPTCGLGSLPFVGGCLLKQFQERERLPL
jgi:hypothetical protein